MTKLAVGSIVESGNIGTKKWWVIESINERTGFVILTRLRWADMSEPGVMYRTEESVRFKNAGTGGYLCSRNLGGFYAPKHPITLKS